jgi:hypothetical protein
MQLPHAARRIRANSPGGFVNREIRLLLRAIATVHA